MTPLIKLKQRLRTATHLLRGFSAFFARHAKAELDPAKVLSIDIFDTLLFQTADFDEILLEKISSDVATLARERGAADMRAGPLEIMRSIETRERNRLRQRGLDEEVWHGDVMKAMLVEILGRTPDPEDIHQLRTKEIEHFHQLTAVNPVMRTLLKEASKLGIRIIAISDSHLNSQELRILLAMHGVTGIAAIYSSCDEGYGKLSGRLFQRVLRQESCAPARTLHIGNDFLRDALSAAACGINFHLVNFPK